MNWFNRREQNIIFDGILSFAAMNSFEEERGSIAHTSGSTYRTKTLPDPKSEFDKVMALLQGLRDIDKLLNKLMP